MSPPKWALSPPNLFDIVTGYYPESRPRKGTPAHRPCLVTAVYQSNKDGRYACQIAYGTKVLKSHLGLKDIIIQNISDMNAMGLPMATRFVLDPEARVTLEWKRGNFMPWTGFRTPKIGALTIEYQKEYAWLMARRSGV